MFSPSAPLLKSAGSSSSRSWLARQVRDPYVKQRLQSQTSYRSRAAFKLLQIDERFKIFKTSAWGEPKNLKSDEALTQLESLGKLKDAVDSNKGSTSSIQSTGRRVVVIDLGAAPGGWSQVVAEKYGVRPHKDADVLSTLTDRKGKGKATDDDLWSRSTVENPGIDPTIVALDILPIAPIRGVTTLRHDFLSVDAEKLISTVLPPDKPKADLILSDIAANVSGNKVRDDASATNVIHTVYQFAKKFLKKKEHESAGGCLIIKFFASPSATQFHNSILRRSFSKVFIYKPPASRSESKEAYFVCKDFLGGIYRSLIRPKSGREVANRYSYLLPQDRERKLSMMNVKSDNLSNSK